MTYILHINDRNVCSTNKFTKLQALGMKTFKGPSLLWEIRKSYTDNCLEAAPVREQMRFETELEGKEFTC